MIDILFVFLGGLGAGFVDSVVGGGGLISLPMMLAAGLSPHHALGTNKIIGISSALTSSLRYRSIGLIDSKWIIRMFLFSFVSAILGAYCASRVSNEVLKPFMILGFVSVAVLFFKKKDFGTMTSAVSPYTKVLAPLFSMMLGFYDGFFGPGTGIFLMLMFVLYFGKNLLEASGNARWLNLSSNLGACVFFYFGGFIHFEKALPGAAGAIVGAMLGVRWSVKHQSAGIKQLALIVIVGLILKIVWSLF